MQSVEPRRDGMDVGILEAGQQRSAPKVDPPRPRAGQVDHISVRSDGDDAAAIDGDGLGDRLVVVDRVDTPTDQDQVGRAGGGHGAGVYRRRTDDVARAKRRVRDDPLGRAVRPVLV